MSAGLAGTCASMYSWNGSLPLRCRAGLPDYPERRATWRAIGIPREPGRGRVTTPTCWQMRAVVIRRLPPTVRPLRPGHHRALVRIIGSDDPIGIDFFTTVSAGPSERGSTEDARGPEELVAWHRRIHGERGCGPQSYGTSPSPASGPDRPAVSPHQGARVVRALYQVLARSRRRALASPAFRGADGLATWPRSAGALSTTRRRIKRAEARFRKALPAYPAIEERLRRQP